MARPDPNNAHIRKTSKRESPDVKAEEAQRLLEDPAFKRAFESMREGLVNELENLKHDGQPETDDYEREICRSLRTLRGIPRAITLAVQGQKLRLADFQAKPPEGE